MKQIADNIQRSNACIRRKWSQRRLKVCKTWTNNCQQCSHEADHILCWHTCTDTQSHSVHCLHDQKCFTISEVAADWYELMIPQCSHSLRASANN